MMIILYAYCFTLLIGALLLIVVGQMAGHYSVARGDPRWLQLGRRSAFWMTAFAALFSVGKSLLIGAMDPLTVLVLVLTAVAVLAIDVVLLKLRKPPPAPTVEVARPVIDIAARARARR